MLDLTILVLAINTINVDPVRFCETYRGNHGVSQYKHCIKGDLIRTNERWSVYVCDFKQGVQIIGSSRSPYVCVYRGEPRQRREAPEVLKARELRKKKEEEMKKSGRKSL